MLFVLQKEFPAIADETLDKEQTVAELDDGYIKSGITKNI